MPERGGLGERRFRSQQTDKAAEAATGQSLGQDAELAARGEDQDRRGREPAREASGGRRSQSRGSARKKRTRINDTRLINITLVKIDQKCKGI